MTKLKNSNGDKTKKIKLQQNSKTQIVTVVKMTVVTVAVVTVVIVTVITVAVVTVVIVTYF